MTQIHPSAIIDSKAQLGKGVEIGPFCYVGPEVVMGDNVHLVSHVTISGRTKIGANCKFYPFSSIGHYPQDLKYNGENSQLFIGENNTIREYVTIQPGTEGGGMITKIGDNNLLMASAHVAHDCLLGDNIIMANCATLGGHVTLEDYAFVGGLAAVHQFVRVGAHSIIGGLSAVVQDVIPYGHVKGERAHLAGLNLVGLKRRGFSTSTIQELRSAYDDLFDVATPSLAERIEVVAKKYTHNKDVIQLIAFIKQESRRSLCLPESMAG